MKKERAIKASLLLFWTVSIINLLSGILAWSRAEAVSKVFIIPSLAVYLVFALSTLEKKIRKWLLFALVFSWLGDVLLLGSESSTAIPFFLLGLAVFLVAHIVYLISFLKIKAVATKSSKPNYNIIGPILLYLIALLYLMWEGLASDMKIPVLVYGMGISSMAVVGFQLKEVITPSYFLGFYSGVILFLISDSIIGLNRFAFEIPFSGFLIMSTYISAQFLMVHYLSKILNNNTLKNN